MRSFLATVVALGVPASIVSFAACGPPASFDHLVGGPPPVAPDGGEDAGPLVADPSLDAPRPVAPLSASWINGSRPHFAWALDNPLLSGAQVIACKDASCTDKAKQKTWTATGTSLQAPEDLEPGVWYWHLVGRTATTVGINASKTWTVLVRGGAGNGSVGGQLNDMNGDGFADLFVSAVYTDQGAPYNELWLLLGSSSTDPSSITTTTSTNDLAPVEFVNVFSTNARITVTDIDGDGISDSIIADESPVQGSATPVPYLQVIQGSADFSNLSTAFDGPEIPSLKPLPNLFAVGDVDGDGHGDLAVGTHLEQIMLFGAKDSLSTFAYLDSTEATADPDAGVLAPPAGAIAVGGYDFNADGISDFVGASFLTEEPGFYILQAKGGERFDDVSPFLDGGAVPTPAISFAYGDVDGDGKVDLAFETTLNGKPSVCLYLGSENVKSAQLACWTPDVAPTGGMSPTIVSADIEGDGKDEILVGGLGGGVDVLRLTAPGVVTPEHLAVDYGTSLTVIHPGRPIPAVWAATRADGSSIAIFSGKDQKKQLLPADLLGAAKLNPLLR